jgi:PAS domain S-box-containing protein
VPVIVEDLAVETRFVPSPLLQAHDVASGLTVVIPGRDEPFGVLGGHTSRLHRFTTDDVNYLQAMANVIGATVERSLLAAAERRAHERLSFLAHASRLLAASLDYETTLQSVADLAGTQIADWMAIYLLDEQGEPKRFIGRHPDPAKNRLVQELLESYSRPVDEGNQMYRVIHRGESLLVAELTDEMLVEAAVDERHLELLRALGATSALSVPITVEGQPIGALSFVRAGGPSYRQGDVGLAEEVARRAGLAIENALLYEKAEDARREAEGRAQASQALQFVGDGVVLIDQAGVIRLFNPAAEVITGLTAGDVVGRQAAEAIPGWATFSERVPVVAGEGGAAARPQTLPIDLGGRELWLSISGVGFRHGTVFAFRDVTEEQAVEKLKSDFVSTISHELRTPLAAIYGAAVTLRRPDMPLEGREREELLGVISGESERLAGIVNDILWTSRIESGGLHVKVEACDGADLARSVVRAAEIQLPHNTAIRLAAPRDLPRVLADADKVRQVLANLVENAIKYSPDGGTIEVRLEQFGDRIRFLVADEGLGIPSREHDRIFEKFYRLDPNLTRGVGGTGLGLYICRELVQRMGGAIRVESSEGAGSTFVVELPAVEEIVAHALVR